jgi:hypothetical protein
MEHASLQQADAEQATEGVVNIHELKASVIEQHSILNIFIFS